MKKFSLLIAILLLSACNQEPYPGGGDLVEEARDPVIPIPTPHALAVDSVINYTEGRQTNYKLIASVDEPGKPILVAENLPPGASFNTETFELTWKPDFFAANDINNPTVKVRDYDIVFELSSTIEPDRNKRRFEVVLRVKDNPRGIRIKRDKTVNVNEGNTLRSIVTITDEDFPTGPFNLEIEDVPTDVKLEKITENEYAIVYKPSYDIVSLTRDRKTSVAFDGLLTVTNPRGGRNTLDTRINVRDTRLEPVVTPPSRVTQSLDVSLQVFAKDENLEAAPIIRMNSGSNPSFGDFTTELIKDENTQSSVLAVNWTNIPPSQNGKSFTLEFETCVFSRVDVKQLCVNSKTDVTIELKERIPPVIDRSNWEIGELIYLGFDRSIYRKVTVTDSEDAALNPTVEIFPKEMREFVKWTRNGDLKVGPFNKEGTFQFSLVATSDYNVSSAESFIVEVFPENRKEVLFFADSTRDPESVFYQKQFDAQMMNPAIQTVSKRNISNRKTLIVTTSTLLDKSNRGVIMKAIEAIPNIVVASPLIENLPEKFLKDLRENYDLDVIGRYSQISQVPLRRNVFEKSPVFQDSIKPIGLKGTASSESANPVIFNGGLYDPNKNCKGVLGISPDGNNPLVVGVVCERVGEMKGRISLMGTEWADFQVSEEDKDIPSLWFNTMIKGTF